MRPRSTLLGDLLTPRYVYFSFHYERDIRRIQQVKNQWVVHGTYEAAGYFDGSLEELAKRESELAVKRAINNGMSGSSVTCVLIGHKTSTRFWVAYEIFRSIERNMGIFGVKIHGIRDPSTGTDLPGRNPFENLAYCPTLGTSRLVPQALFDVGVWDRFPDAELVEPSTRNGLISGQRNSLADLIPVYDWIAQDGRQNFRFWVDQAARAAGR